MNWYPEDMHYSDIVTWNYTVLDKHFWPPDGLVSQDASFFVDVGANVGFTTGLLADQWKNAKILGIEMNPTTAQRARNNLVEFGERITIIEAAIGFPEREDVGIFSACNTMDHIQKYNVEIGIANIIKVITLDTCLKETKLDDRIIDFLKIDVEGAEWEIIEDNGKWVDRTKVICVEIHNSAERDKILPDDFVKKMEGLGFKTIKNPNHVGIVTGYKNV